MKPIEKLFMKNGFYKKVVSVTLSVILADVCTLQTICAGNEMLQITPPQ